MWVQGEKFRIERRQSTGATTVALYDGKAVYRFSEKGKAATMFERSRARDFRTWDSMGKYAAGRSSLEASEAVSGVPCDRIRHLLPAGQDQVMPVTEWVSPSLGRAVLKRIQSTEQWTNTMEMKEVTLGIPEDPSRFVLPTGLPTRATLSRNVKSGDFVGKPVEDFLMKTAGQGEMVSLSKVYGAHQAVLVNFFATWCGPCRKETPDMVDVLKKFQNRDVAFLSVDVGEKGDVQAKIRDYVKQYGVTWPVVLDDQYYNDQYAAAIPTNLIIDSKGIIRAYRLGGAPKEWFEQELEKVVQGESRSEKP